MDGDGAPALDAHAAAEGLWAWQSLRREAGDGVAALPCPSRGLVAAAAVLPFRVHCGALAGRAELDLGALRREVRLRRDVIASGSARPSAAAILEKRLTAWHSDVGAPFCYANKSMTPSPLPAALAKLRDALADACGYRFDSVLVNLYEDGESGMRFHSDPGQGEAWGYATCVVSLGDTRLFVMRRADDKQVRCTFAVREGDVVEMFGNCQARYQHSVKVERETTATSARMSLVFKRTLANERAFEAAEVVTKDCRTAKNT